MASYKVMFDAKIVTGFVLYAILRWHNSMGKNKTHDRICHTKNKF